MSEIQTLSSSSVREEHYWTDMVCRRCRRCVAACPAGIDIPSLLNAQERVNAGEEEARVRGDVLAARQSGNSGGQPIDCIECGICSRRCPQGFHLLEIVRRYAMKQASGEET